MRFLGGLFRILLAVIAVAFAYNNWTMVPIKLWSGLIAEINLPLLLLLAFLAGLVPMLLVYHASRWRFRQRLGAADRALTEAYRPPVVTEPLSPASPPTAPADPAIAP